MSQRLGMRHPSLALRLLLFLALAQVSSLVLSMAAWMAFSPAVTWEDVAAESARGLIVESITADAGGALSIVPTPRLAAYVARRSGFGYAASDSVGHLLPGSSQSLMDAAARLGSRLPRQGMLDIGLPDGRLALVASVDTTHGPISIATVGNHFLLEDSGSFFAVYLLQLLPVFLPLLLAAGIVVPLAISRALRPLEMAATQVSRMSLQDLGLRLSNAGAPKELQPFVGAIDELLARLESAVGQQKQFFANAAHELRTPTAILQARIDALPDTASRLDLQRDARRIGLLVDELLAVSKLTSAVPDCAERVDVVAMARDVVADFAPLALRAGRQIALDATGASIAVIGSTSALRSALANLIDNALRAEPVGGTVDVVVRGDAGAINILVRDHGIGVAKEDREQIFAPYWSKDPFRPGGGLGLGIVRDIAHAHGGSVDLLPHAGVPGATFRVTLPLPAD